MKKNQWSIKAALLLLTCSLTSLPGIISAQEQTEMTRVVIDGQELETTTFSQNGHMMVPATFLSKIGTTVGWDEQKQAVVLQREKNQLVLPSGKSHAALYVEDQSKWRKDEIGLTIMNQADATYIPFRYAVESLGMNVHFDPAQEAVSIDTTIKPKQNQSNEIKWLYRITEAEAGGESYQGKVAVAASILNRVESPDWPNTIKDVIFQVVEQNGKKYYQYSPVKDKRIYQVSVTEETRKAVQEALNGKDPSKGAVVFFNPDKTDNKWVRTREVTGTIGDHVFAQ
ncbi:cell wall hydrolase [Ammoniphilus resinae]|uniref:Uncharacterized protein n=1 Tax=Ammoniphilus resinae TaxID=861532 RepID=A0ABS4GVZ7_9BACL|nr:cell wall hydrolase [Ammoniphilus resinae]MBP1934440.1 hypothetical protein [Ammoniphilus resinae]